jgi:hypothetical protein
VRAQDADGSLVLVPDDPRLGDTDHPLRGVLLRCGIPGAFITYQNPVGERVRLAFEGADPRNVYALPGHDQATGTVHGVARAGDPVGYLSATCAAAPGPVTFVVSPTPTGSPGEVALSILAGSPEVKIR